MKIREETIALFNQDKDFVIDYFKSRKLNNEKLFALIRKYSFGLLEDAKFTAAGEPYEITHFLTKSDVMGYDVSKVNDVLGLRGTDEVAFAVVLGDDVLCCNAKTGKVYIWLIQSGDREKIGVDDSLTTFLEKLSKEKD